MLPLWPSINPSLIGSLMNNGTTGVTNEEQEISALEQEQQNFLSLVETIAQDVTPLGKKESEQANEDSDAESVASEDQESSASEDHESEDDNDGRESFTVGAALEEPTPSNRRKSIEDLPISDTKSPRGIQIF